MCMTDPIADLLTRVRNANRIDDPSCDIPYSKIKRGLVDILKREGFIKDFRELDLDRGFKALRVYLKYGPDGERLMSTIKRVSKPGCRVYRPVTEIAPVLNGLGIGVYTTSRGILTDKDCREQRVGGECLCEVW